MTCDELKRIPLISILNYLQIPCARMNSREAWFKNPLMEETKERLRQSWISIGISGTRIRKDSEEITLTS